MSEMVANMLVYSPCKMSVHDRDYTLSHIDHYDMLVCLNIIYFLKGQHNNNVDFFALEYTYSGQESKDST